MIESVKISKREYFNCPHCKKHEFTVGHIREMKMVREEFTWACDCGWSTTFKMDVDEIKISKVEQTGVAGVMVLCFSACPQIKFLVKFRRPNCWGDMEEGTDSYFVNQGTCPTNLLMDGVLDIIEDKRKDPHGVFVFDSWHPCDNTDKDVTDKIADEIAGESE